MSSSNLSRMSGWALVVGALMMSVSAWFRFSGQDYATGVHPFLATSWLVTIIGASFVLIGLPAMYMYQSRRAGKLGLIGFVMTFLGLTILEVGSAVLDGSGIPQTQASAGFTIAFTAGFVGLNLGLIIYGIATFRARVYPRWAAVMLSAGVPVIFVLGQLPRVGAKPEVLVFLGLAWCGLTLLRTVPPSGRAVVEPAAQTARS